MNDHGGILKLEIESQDLQAQRTFYTKVLGFQEMVSNNDALRLQVGRSELIFRPAPAGELPCYHFAFNISSNKAPQARQWLLARGVPLLKDADGDFFNSEEWNAHQMYFGDADGNIVEFIARHNLPHHSSGPFGAPDVLGISEIGIVVPDVLGFVDDGIRASGLTPYVDDPGPGFTALGDEYGLLICVRERRPWYPENRVLAAARPAVVWMGAARTGELTKPPYCFHFIANAQDEKTPAQSGAQSLVQLKRHSLGTNMRITGINWILAPTRKFDELVAFFRDVMDMAVTDQGVPVTDTQFSRYAQLRVPNGVALEIVEPKETVAHLYHAPVISITVDDVAKARREFESRQIEFLTPIFDTKQGWGWTYFRAPDETVYQLQGPYGSPSNSKRQNV